MSRSDFSSLALFYNEIMELRFRLDDDINIKVQIQIEAFTREMKDLFGIKTQEKSKDYIK